MYCSSCGGAVAQGLSYCKFCGAKLNGEKGKCVPGKRFVMKRYHQELERTKRVHRLHLCEAHKGVASINCVCEFQIGRFRKRKAFGCNKSRCLLCHYEKIFGIAAVKDRIREQQFLDSLNECLNYIDLS